MPLLRFLPEDTKIDFIGARYFAFAVDGLLLLISIISIAIHGFNLGIDFTGGALLQVQSAHVIDIGAMRTEVNSLKFGDSEIQSIGGGHCDQPPGSCALIRVQPKANQSGDDAAAAIRAKLGASYTYLNAQVIGPKVSGELFQAGVWATVLAIIGIAAWVAVRFEWQYGTAAAIATGHDVQATAVSIIPLLIFGGPALFDFTAAILFGIVVGTFSSTYVAAALLLYLPAPAGSSGSEETAVA